MSEQGYAEQTQWSPKEAAKPQDKPSYKSLDHLHRQTRDFEEIPGGKIRRRHNRHQRGEIHHWAGDRAYTKGIQIKQQDEKKRKQYLIEEGINCVAKQQEDEQKQCPFDPKDELKALWEFGKDQKTGPLTAKQRAERRGKLQEYKQRLVQQEVQIGALLDTLYATVKQDPLISTQALKQIVFLRAEEAHLAPRQRNRLLSGIDTYARKHDAVMYYAGEYKTPADFYEACFGKRPVGKVEVDLGAMTVNFRCFNKDDYAEIFYGNIENMNQEEKIERGMQSGGVALFDGRKIPALAGTITAENAVNNQETLTDESGNSYPSLEDTDWSLGVRRHEEQHSFNKLFVPKEDNDYLYGIFARTTQRIDNVYQQNGQITPIDQKHIREQLIHDFALWKRKQMGIDTRARDEILAYYRQGVDTAGITNKLNNNKLYDYKNDPYYKNQIEDIPQEIQDALADPSFASITWYLGNVRSAEVQQQINKVFGAEYHQDVLKWIQAVNLLEVKGYTEDQIIGLLYGKSASNWMAFAKRAYEKNYLPVMP